MSERLIRQESLSEEWLTYVVHKDLPERIYDWPRTRENIPALQAHSRFGDTYSRLHVWDCPDCQAAALAFTVETGWEKQIFFFAPWDKVKTMTHAEVVRGGLPKDTA